jgi:hypothetical protein
MGMVTAALLSPVSAFTRGLVPWFGARPCKRAQCSLPEWGGRGPMDAHWDPSAGIVPRGVCRGGVLLASADSGGAGKASMVDAAEIKGALAVAREQIADNVQALDLPSLRAKIDYFEREAAQVCRCVMPA